MVLYLKGATITNEFEVISSNENSYVVAWFGGSIIVDKKTMKSSVTGENVWSESEASCARVEQIIQEMQQLVVSFVRKSKSEDGRKDILVAYDRLKKAGVV